MQVLDELYPPGTPAHMQILRTVGYLLFFPLILAFYLVRHGVPALCRGVGGCLEGVISALGSACECISGGFVWLWEHCLGPVCAGLGRVGRAAWDTLGACCAAFQPILRPLGEGLLAAVRAIGRGLKAVNDHCLAPVCRCVGDCCQAVCNAVSECCTVLCRALTRCGEAICDGLGKCCSALGRCVGGCCDRFCRVLTDCLGCLVPLICDPLWQLLSSLCTPVGRFLTVLAAAVAEYLVQPTTALFRAIATAIGEFLEQVLPPIGKAIVAAVQAVTGAAVAVFEALARAFQALGAAIFPSDEPRGPEDSALMV